MKKHYLIISALCAFTSAWAQGPAKMDASVMVAGEAQIASDEVKNDIDRVLSSTVEGKAKGVSNRGNVNYKSFVRIGSTYYDLQSNYSMSRRILLHSDGSVSAAWTTSPDDVSGFPQRGTGFNFRSTAGTWNASDSTRVEATTRTGWPCLGLLSDGREFVIGHEANQGGFFISKSSSVGARPTGASLILQEVPFKPIWARGANNGDTLHLIHSYSDSTASGDVRAPLRKGIRAPMVYNRSLDGGINWDIQKLMLPGYDSSLTNNGGADQYAIDCQGNTVAIVNADNLQGVIAWKSTDFGTSWTRIIVDTFKYAPYSSKNLMPDTPFTNDGTCDVVIDNSGKLHVFWGLGRVLDTDNSDESYSFFPGIQGLMHWDEATDGSHLIASGADFDRDGDGISGLSAETSQALATGNPPSGLNTVARLGNTSCMRQPSASIDAAGNIYCVFSEPIEADLSDLNANFRDIGVVFSQDKGQTWSNPQNLTQLAGVEDDFACVARRSNNFLHMMWQQDEYPGTNLQNNSTTFGNHPVTLNKIAYQAVPLANILDESIGMTWGVNVEEPNTGELLIVNQNYPNPFSGTTLVTIALQKPGDVLVNVNNTTGALVRSFTVNSLFQGNHQLEIDATGLASGIYTYSITSGASKVSRTMMVK
jgi:hypothetical protein